MLEKDIREITNIPEKEMIFQKEEEERFDKETKCWICNGEFNDSYSYEKEGVNFQKTGLSRNVYFRFE